MNDTEKEEEMICGLTADERDTLRAGLNQLPQTVPPRIVWDRIRDQAEALARRRRARGDRGTGCADSASR